MLLGSVCLAAPLVLGDELSDSELLKVDEERITKTWEEDGIKHYLFAKEEEYGSKQLNEVVTTSKLNEISKIGYDAEETVEETMNERDYNVQKFHLTSSTTISVVYSGIAFYKEIATGLWHESDYATTTIEAWDEQTKPSLISRIIGDTAHAASSTFYPDAHIETDTVDGFAQARVIGWDAAHDSAGTNSGDGNLAEAMAHSFRPLTNDYQIKKGIFLFDTSSIAGTDTIDSATLDIVPQSITRGDQDAQEYYAVVQMTNGMAADTSIANADYAQVGDAVDNPTKGSGDISGADFTAEDYYSFALNADGKSWIARAGETKPAGANSAGITYYGVREGHDIEDEKYAGAVGTRNEIVIYFSETAGKKPKLVVQHSEASTPTEEEQVQTLIW